MALEDVGGSMLRQPDLKIVYFNGVGHKRAFHPNDGC
jgi:hypothetical protein